MIVASERSDGFRPVKLTITMETKREMDTIHTLFNCIPVCQYLRDRDVSPESIRTAIEPHPLYSSDDMPALSDLMRVWAGDVSGQPRRKRPNWTDFGSLSDITQGNF